MKTTLLLFLLFFAGIQTAYCKADTTVAGNTDTNKTTHTQTVKKTVDSSLNSLGAGNTSSVSHKTTTTDSTTTTNVSPPANKPAVCPCQFTASLNFWEWLLVFTPILLLIAFAIMLLWGKALSEFDFKGALSENEMPKYTIINPEYTNITSIASVATPPSNLNEILPPTLDLTLLPPATTITANYRPSISRYIAFFSGMLTVIIAASMVSFFIYYYIRTGCTPDLSTLSTVLIALGIGVTPYAVNKVSTAIASRKPEE